MTVKSDAALSDSNVGEEAKVSLSNMCSIASSLAGEAVTLI